MYNLFTTYGNLKQILGIHLGSLVISLSRGQYFFTFLTFFIFINLAIFFYAELVKRVPKQLLIIPNRSFWTQDVTHRRAVNQMLSNWMWAIASTINYFIIFWMLVVESQYHFEGSTISSIGWFYIPGLVMASSLIFPVFRLMVKNINLLERNERQ